MKKPTAKNFKVKVLTLAALGYCFELYDFVVYAALLPFLADALSPSTNPLINQLFILLGFAITFFIAPIGSVFWGWYGDKFGRIKMLTLAIMVMSIPSLAIALLPSYSTIGIAAPILLLCFRLLQGISAGGGIMGSKIFALEALGVKHQGLASGVLSAAGAVGVLLAMLMGYFVSSHIKEMPSAWRAPFFLGSFLIFIAVLIRTYLARSLMLTQKLAKDNCSLLHIFKILKEFKHNSMVVFMLGGFLGITSYTMHAFMNTFLIQELDFSKDLVYIVSVLGYIFTIIASLTIGFGLDKVKLDLRQVLGRTMLLSAFAFAFLIPVVSLGGVYIFIGYAVFDFLLGIYATTSAIVMYRAFHSDIRCRGVLFNYAIGVAIFGGSTPIALTFLSKINIYTPGIVLFVVSIAIFAVFKKNLRVLKEHAH